LAFLHDRKIVHCDLKSKNVLLDKHMNAKISDFGISKILSSTTSATTSSSVSFTVPYTAPEILLSESEEIKEEGQEENEEKKSQEKESQETVLSKSDCYSFGIVLWEIFSESIPYANNKQTNTPAKLITQVLLKDLRPTPLPSTNSCSVAFIELMKKCWSKNPQDRPSMIDILSILKKEEIQMKQDQMIKKRRTRPDKKRRRCMDRSL